MKRFASLVLSLLVIVTTFNCSDDNEQKVKEYPKQEVKFMFIIDDVKTDYAATFQYSDEYQRFVDISGTLTESIASDFTTKELIYVYTLKQYDIAKNARTEWGQRVGYYGYSGGCFFWGTELTGDNGETIFIRSSSNFNPPICPGGEWAYVAKPTNRITDFTKPITVDRRFFLPY